MALERVTEFFGVHLTPQVKQDLRVVAALAGKKTPSEYVRELLEKDIHEKLTEAGLRS